MYSLSRPRGCVDATMRLAARTSSQRSLLFSWVQRLAVTRMSMCLLMRLTSSFPFHSLLFLALLLFFFLFLFLLLLLFFLFFFYLPFPYSQFAFKCRRAGTISVYLYYVTPMCCVGGEYGESRSFSVPCFLRYARLVLHAINY